MGLTTPFVILLLLSLRLFVFASDSDDNQRHNLIILLIDGYGASLFNRTDPKLQDAALELIKNGVKAELKPVFPTQSYPNWYSLATGLYVESHNFTADFMYDPERNVYFQKDEGKNDSDTQWWAGGPSPLWYTVGKNKIDVHCYFFASCHRPHTDLIIKVPQERQHSFKNEKSYDLFKDIEKIMKHVKKYQEYRQQLVLLRYNGLSKSLRMFSDDSDASKQALASADAQIRKLQDSMVEHNLFDTTNLIVLSDFGLKAIDEHQFFVEECLADVSKVKRVVNSLAFMMVYPEEGAEDTIYFELRVCDQWASDNDYSEDDEAPPVGVYRKSEIPERYHWKHSRFISPIVLIARPGAILLTTQIPSTDVSEAQGREFRMLSGWDNEDPDMQGIFLARGPAFKHDYISSPIEVVDIHDMALKLLGIGTKNPTNGTWENVAEMMSNEWEEPEDTDFSNTCFASMSILVFSLMLQHVVFGAF